MVMLTRKTPKLTYRQILQAARQLPARDRHRLRVELAEQVGVYLVPPNEDVAAVRRGRRLLKAVKAELAAADLGTLDEVMTRLRGQSWSS